MNEVRMNRNGQRRTYRRTFDEHLDPAIISASVFRHPLTGR